MQRKEASIRHVFKCDSEVCRLRNQVNGFPYQEDEFEQYPGDLINLEDKN